jgi:membrane protein
MRRTIDLGVAFIAGAAAVELVRTATRPLTRMSEGDRGDKGGAAFARWSAPTPGLGQANQGNRGRDANRPRDIPRRGWKDIVVRTFKEFGDDQIPLVAAGCTFYTLLALFPGVAAFVALYGLFSDAAEAARHVQAMSAVLPSGAVSLISEQVVKVATTAESQLSLAFGLGLATALWSANKAVKAIITGLNIAYDEKEKRGLVLKTLVPLAFTVGLVAFALSAFALGAGSAVLGARFGPVVGFAVSVIYWLTLFLGVVLGMALLYRFGPSRSPARWRWITWGSGLAALAWVGMSGAFTFYVANFGNYDEKYGALGAAIGFMTWVWLSSMVFLLGAELNSEIEHQTARDTTTGAPEPLGARGAVMADTIGEAV